MNLERYKWPVIVAASLHGALFVSYTDTTDRPLVPHDKPPVLIPVPLTEPVVVPPKEEPRENNAVIPMPRGTPRPEIPAELLTAKDPKFPVPLEPSGPIAPRNIIKIGPIGVPDGLDSVEWTGGPPKFLSPGWLDRVPNAKVQIAPDYPAGMRRDGIEGSVTVEFNVDATGSVVSARVLRSTHRDFEAPTLRAVMNWRFEPGRRFGRAVPFRMAIPIEFNIGNN